MPLPPPLLEVYIVWHPDDGHVGEQVATLVQAHFHGPAFSGLAGGAVEVYVRSEPWDGDGSAPRPMPFQAPLPHGLPAAHKTVVIPLLATHLARAVADENSSWASYITDIADAATREDILVLPAKKPDPEPDSGRPWPGRLGPHLAALEDMQCARYPEAGDSGEEFCRDISQAIAQYLSGAPGEPITIFISHTKKLSAEEDDADGPRLYDQVRRVLLDTKLGEFFDASDLQLGDDWAQRLDEAAGHSALLIVRTDRYAEREWTQREVLVGKRRDVPAVVLHALRGGEERGSFLMDHLPALACDLSDPEPAIKHALQRLVDETLKRALWEHQTVYLEGGGFDWRPVHSPEPITLIHWLAGHPSAADHDVDFIVVHPDPPLGSQEREVIDQVCESAGFAGRIEILTPRTFASRGGRLDR